MKFILLSFVYLFFYVPFLYASDDNDLKNQISNSKKYQLAREDLTFFDIDNINRSVIDKIQSLLIYKQGDYEVINFGGYEFIKNTYFLPQITSAIHPRGYGSAFLEVHKNNLLVITADGNFATFDVKNLEVSSQGVALKMKKINSNIREISGNLDFGNLINAGLRDVLIDENRLYITMVGVFSDMDKCYNTSIFVSDLEFDPSKNFYKDLKFEKFYIPKKCLVKLASNEVEKDFYKKKINILNSGGKLVNYKDGKLLFSHGTYSDYIENAQNKNNVFGSIIAIDKNYDRDQLNNNIEFIAIGVRNPQGMYYDNSDDIIYFTDHGPKGGDEINLITSQMLKDQDIINFGWPVASYGEHYGFIERDDKHDKYKASPLYKSHKDYNFVEPIKYFVPSIGISSLISLEDSFTQSESREIIFGSLGRYSTAGLSIYYASFNDDLTLKELDKYKLNQRIRDIIYLEKYKMILIFGESSAEITTLTSTTVMDENYSIKKK